MQRNGELCLSTLRRAKNGDTYALEAAGRALMDWARRRVSRYRGLDQEDLVGAFIAQLCDNRFASLPDNDEKRLEAYLQQCLFNRALKEYGALKRRSWITEFSDPDEEEAVADCTSVNPEAVVLGRDTLHRLLAAAQHLTPENRQLLLAAAGGATHRELSERFHLKPNTLAQRLWSIRQQLRRTMEILDP